MTANATDIPLEDANISITCGRDGTWLHFHASNGKSASLNIDLMNHGHVIGAALHGWCEDRQKQAGQIRADNGQFGVGA